MILTNLKSKGVVPKHIDKFLGVLEYIPPLNGKELASLVRTNNYLRWRQSIKGDVGVVGDVGEDGDQGNIGLSAYEIEKDLLQVINLSAYNNKLSIDYFKENISKYSSIFTSYWDTRIVDNNSSYINQITIPLVANGNYDFAIMWGDGSVESVTNYRPLTHTYKYPGVYQINIFGKLNGFSFKYSTDELKLLEINKWGAIKFDKNIGAFRNCKNLIITAIDVPKFNNEFTFREFFLNCHSITTIPNIQLWPWHLVNDITSMFQGCINLVEDLNFVDSNSYLFNNNWRD